MTRRSKHLWQQLKTEQFFMLVGVMSPLRAIYLDEKWLWLKSNSMYLPKGSLEMLLNVPISCGLYAE